MSKKELTFGDEFYTVRLGPLDGFVGIQKNTVTTITKGNGVLTYNDGIKPSYMFDDFGAAQKAAVEKVVELSKKNIEHIKYMTEDMTK